MTNRLVQEDLDVVFDIEEYIEYNDPQNLESPLEADNVSAELKVIWIGLRGAIRNSS